MFADATDTRSGLNRSTVQINPDESTDEITLNIPEHLVPHADLLAASDGDGAPAPGVEALLRRDNDNLLTPPQLGRKKVAVTVALSPAASYPPSTSGTPAAEARDDDASDEDMAPVEDASTAVGPATSVAAAGMCYRTNTDVDWVLDGIAC